MLSWNISIKSFQLENGTVPNINSICPSPFHFVPHCFYERFCFCFSVLYNGAHVIILCDDCVLWWTSSDYNITIMKDQIITFLWAGFIILITTNQIQPARKCLFLSQHQSQVVVRGWWLLCWVESKYFPSNQWQIQNKSIHCPLAIYHPLNQDSKISQLH